MDAMAVALQGLQRSQTRVEQSVVRLVRSTAPDAVSAGADSVGISQEMVNLLAARSDFRASVEVVKTTDQMLQQIVNLLA